MGIYDIAFYFPETGFGEAGAFVISPYFFRSIVKSTSCLRAVREGDSGNSESMEIASEW